MNLLIKFTDQSKSFAHGVEFGRMWEKMERGDETVTNSSFPIREENVHILKDTCKSYGYVASFGKEQFGWVEFIGIKKTTSNN